MSKAPAGADAGPGDMPTPDIFDAIRQLHIEKENYERFASNVRADANKAAAAGDVALEQQCVGREQLFLFQAAACQLGANILDAVAPILPKVREMAVAHRKKTKPRTAPAASSESSAA